MRFLLALLSRTFNKKMQRVARCARIRLGSFQFRGSTCAFLRNRRANYEDGVFYRRRLARESLVNEPSARARDPPCTEHRRYLCRCCATPVATLQESQRHALTEKSCNPARRYLRSRALSPRRRLSLSAERRDGRPIM